MSRSRAIGSHDTRDAFLRELISNANDALEKLRIVALTEKDVWSGTSPLNVTIKAEPNPDGKGGRIIITGEHSFIRAITNELMQCFRHGYRDERGRTDNQFGIYYYWFCLWKRLIILLGHPR